MREMKRILVLILVTVVILTGTVLFWPRTAEAYQQQPTATPTPAVPPGQSTGQATIRTVSVQGDGKVTARPDTAVIVVGVQTEAETASAALTANSRQMNSLLTALRTAGIAEDDIQTTMINLYPRYDNQPTSGGQTQPGQPQVTGYVAANTVEVRVANLTDLGEILDATVQAGGNRIDNIRFEIADQEALLTQAREDAMAKARQKAEQLADLAGATLGPVVTINENVAAPPIFYGTGGMDVAQAESVPVQPGTQDVTLNVQVTWELVLGRTTP